MNMREAVRSAGMDEATRAVAKEFLQSVVVVDDRAMFGGEDLPRTSAGSADASDHASESTKEMDPETRSRARRRLPVLRRPARVVAVPVPEQALDAKVLVDGFAKEGLVCAVIRPAPEEAQVDQTVQAVARRADIVVLDWELNSDGGETTVRIIRELVHKDTEAQPRGRLRLIAVYSGALALRKIASVLRRTLSAERGLVRFRKVGDFAITSGSVRVAVFGKPTTRLPHADQTLRTRIVDGVDLPVRLIAEFAELTTGLVPHVALASLAALRRNMHRVLGRLRADLDAGYLWHRATQVRPADAEEHVVSLVAAELRSVLDDERVGEWADVDAIRQWLERDGRDDFAAAFGETSARSRDDVLALVTKGAAGKADANKDVRGKFPKMWVDKKPHAEEIAAFSQTPEAARQSNQAFAALMSLRTRYEHPPPRLELGTVLSRGRGSSRTFWLCVQPRCDSVRLNGHTAFPLLPLEAVAADKKFDLLLPDARTGYRRCRLIRKPAKMVMQVFEVNPTEDTVIAKPYGRRLVFHAQGGVRYTWVAELKTDHAQRIAQEVASAFSRVGLTESEWLRLWASKGNG